MLLADFALRNSSVKSLVKMVRIRVHEDRLPSSARRKVRNSWLGLHVLQRIHPDTQMRQQGVRQSLAQLIINR